MAAHFLSFEIEGTCHNVSKSLHGNLYNLKYLKFLMLLAQTVRSSQSVHVCIHMYNLGTDEIVL
jgi:hypothetical protein